jgi:hypothetical protein
LFVQLGSFPYLLPPAVCLLAYWWLPCRFVEAARCHSSGGVCFSSHRPLFECLFQSSSRLSVLGLQLTSTLSRTHVFIRVC